MKYKPVESIKYPGWFSAPGYPDFLANKQGQVWNIKSNHKSFGSLNSAGYRRCCIFDNQTKTKKEYKVHRIVCSAFRGRCPSKNHEVGHMDDDRGNNKYGNLEWVTRQQNMKRVHSKNVKAKVVKRISTENSVSGLTLSW